MLYKFQSYLQKGDKVRVSILRVKQSISDITMMHQPKGTERTEGNISMQQPIQRQVSGYKKSMLVNASGAYTL